MKECTFKLGRSRRTIQGGPYRDCPPTHFGVKMAAEINACCDVSVPTRDFSTPKMLDMERGILKVLKPLALGKPIYVGCMGGIGRTGLFLACLAKMLGEDDPVQYVRDNYYAHAVETQGQMSFVQYFESQKIQKLLWRYKVAAWVVDTLRFDPLRDWTIKVLSI